MNVAGCTFKEVWAVDFEFRAADGEQPAPVCLVARELASGRILRIWEDDLRQLRQPPYSVGPDSLIIAYYASAEMGCHLALGWELPTNILDLFTEFRCFTNGRPPISGVSLLGALVHYGLDSIGGAEKESMRELALRGGPYTETEKSDLLDYCQSDVDALAKLLPCMTPNLDMPRALLRGRYMAAATRIEHNGIPIDMDNLKAFRNYWEAIQEKLIERIDTDYGIFEGKTFKTDRWAAWLAEHNIPWPHLPTGNLSMDDSTFRYMEKSYPEVSPIRELRLSLSKLRLANLAVGADGRNRYMLSAFRAKTGRNQPSNSKSIYGPSVWIRGLIKPQPGWGLAYVDWSQQEFGIAGALSGDPAMKEAYASGDPYLAFAKQAGAAPPEGTKDSHGEIRDQYKACVLAVQYGMGAKSLATRIGQPGAAAEELLRKHRKTYSRFWTWVEAAVNHAMLHGKLHTVFGWTRYTETNANTRSISNFPMQANGAEMLRLACIYVSEAGIRICAPVHDALLIEAPLEELDETVKQTQAFMAKASEDVLSGFQLRSDAKVVRYPDRYMDERGQQMWDTVQEILKDLEKEEQQKDETGISHHGVLT